MRNIELISTINKSCTDLDKTLFDAKKMISTLKKHTGRILDGMNGLQKMIPKSFKSDPIVTPK